MSRSSALWMLVRNASCVMVTAVATVAGAGEGGGRTQDPAVPVTETSALTPGARVRITVPSLRKHPLVGTLVGVEDDSLTVQFGGRQNRKVQTVPRASITTLEVSRGRERHIGMGAMVGAMVGFVGVGALVVASGGSAGDDLAAAVMGVGAAVGAGLGAFGGAMMQTDRWQEVQPGSVQIGVGPTRGGGVEVQVRLAFGRGR